MYSEPEPLDPVLVELVTKFPTNKRLYQRYPVHNKDISWVESKDIPRGMVKELSYGGFSVVFPPRSSMASLKASVESLKRNLPVLKKSEILGKSERERKTFL